MKIKLTKLPTPDNINLITQNETLLAIGTFLNEQFKEHKTWTLECSEKLGKNPLVLFLYDQFEYSIGNAFGSHECKIAFNPLMVLCLHPACRSKGARAEKLSQMFDLSPFIKHLYNHFDNVGESMQARFKAIQNDKFISKEKLDEISVSPYQLMNNRILLEDKTVVNMNNFAINRQLKEIYICHWKSKLIQNGLLDNSSLSFQEDDARIYMVLHYPNPVVDWKNWKTLYWYHMKMLVSTDAHSHNLLRGSTDYPRLIRNSNDSKEMNVELFNRKINHPGPGQTTLNRFFPAFEYLREEFHDTEIMFHVTVLQNCNESVLISYKGCHRYPITLGIDDQEINPGTFVDEKNGILQGLTRPLCVKDIKTIGVNNIAEHITLDNNFLTAVTEYRCTDLKGSMCSNAFTAFISGSSNTDECVSALLNVAKLVTRCWNCLLQGKDCKYEQLYNKCAECEVKNILCVSLVVFNVLWDMASIHKSAANAVEKIDVNSDEKLFSSSNLFSLSYGGLHLCKCVVNAARCFSKSNEGENFGIYILRALRNGGDKCAELLSQVKAAVLVCKDRQSDLLSYKTVCPLVQEALIMKDNYSLLRIPEKILYYTENAKSQLKIVYPVEIKININGDVFILDQGASCIHAYNRADVAKEFTIGKYNVPCNKQYPVNPKEQLCAKNLSFSDSLQSMEIHNENLIIADKSQIFVLRNCMQVESILSKRVFIIKNMGCIGLAADHDILLLFCKDKDNSLYIKALEFKFPAGKGTGLQVYLDVVEKSHYSFDHTVVDIFRFDTFGYSFGARCNDNRLIFFKKDGSVYEKTISNIESSLRPSYDHLSKTLLKYSSSSGSIEKLTCYVNCFQLAFKPRSKTNCISTPVALSIWKHGKLVYVVGQTDNGYAVEEIGSLNFAVEFCNGVQRFYDAIGYIPPGGDQSKRMMNLMECIVEEEVLLKLLSSMQSEREKEFPGRKSFHRSNGLPFSETINCVQMTVDALKGLVERLNFLKPGLHLQVYPHAVCNEYLVENAFGFTMKKGQGHLQTQMEYTQSKRKHALDFQMKMCDAPFEQYSKVKLRDKGYQEINPALKSKVSLDDLSTVFSKKGKSEENTSSSLSSEDEKILKTAWLLSKSVPRQTNRCKWREKSGYVPNMLMEKKDNGLVKEGDLVFFESFEGLVYLKVLKDVILSNKITSFEVCPVSSTDVVQFVTPEKLMTHKGQIVVIPSMYWSPSEDGQNGISIADVAYEMYAHILDQVRFPSVLSEEEWSALLSTNDVKTSRENDVSNCQSSSKKRTKLFQESSMKKKIVKKKKEFVINDILLDTWRALVPPAKESDLQDSWVAYIFNVSKKKNQLIFGRLKKRFLQDDDGSDLNLCKWEVKSCCKPYRLESTSGRVEEVPSGEEDFVQIFDIFYFFLPSKKLISYDKSGEWIVHNISEVLDCYYSSLEINREKIALENL